MRAETSSSATRAKADRPVAYGTLDALHLLQYYRAEAKFEYDLLHQRMMWLTTCQTIFLSLATLLLSQHVSPYPDFVRTALFVLPILGVVITVAAWLAIGGALQTIELWKDRKATLLLEAPSSWSAVADCDRPRSPTRDVIHSHARWFPVLLVSIFGLAWIAVFVTAHRVL